MKKILLIEEWCKVIKKIRILSALNKPEGALFLIWNNKETVKNIYCKNINQMLIVKRSVWTQWNVNTFFHFGLYPVICVFDLDFWKPPFMFNNAIINWRIKQRHWNIQSAFHCDGCKLVFSETTLLVDVHLFLLVVAPVSRIKSEGRFAMASAWVYWPRRGLKP